MLFLCHYAVVLVRNIKLYGNAYYFLFGSHSRNSRDITDDQPGHSILIKSAFLYEVERYIEAAYILPVEYMHLAFRFSLSQ